MVVTNPRNMGSVNRNAKLSELVKKYYPDNKSDLLACFIERGNNMVGKARYNCMVTMQSWMFISSFEKLRESILFHSDITAVMHMETMVLSIAFGTVVSVFRKIRTVQYKGRYSYVHYNELDNDNQLEEISSDSLITRKNEDFLAIPGTPITYWITPAMLKIFRDNPCLSESFISGGRNKTHNDDKYLRYIWEVCPSAKWKLYAKGGDNRKWYGNLFKGRYSAGRVLRIGVNFMVFLSMAGLMVSGIILSREVFAFLPLEGGLGFARTLHMVSAYWGFILMSVHLGLHWGMVMNVVKKAAGISSASKVRSLIVRAVALAVCCFGGYALIRNNIADYLLMRSQFVFFDMEMPLAVFFAEYLAMMGLWGCLAYYVDRVLATC